MQYSYNHKNNCVYEANSTLLLLLLMPYFFLPFVFTNPLYLSAMLVNFGVVMIAGQSSDKIVSILKFAAFLSVFTFLITLLLRNDGETILYQTSFRIPLYGKFVVTKEVLIIAGILVLQLIAVFFCFSLLNTFVNPDDLMKVLLKLKMPYLAYFLVAISIRFFPVLMDDLDNIQDAQKTRGLQLESGNLFTRIKNRVGILLPLLSNSLERTIQISEALEARGFGLKKAEKIQNEKENRVFGYRRMQATDWATLGIHYAFIILLVYFRIAGQHGFWEIRPMLNQNPLTVVDFWLVSGMILINGAEMLIMWNSWRKKQ